MTDDIADGETVTVDEGHTRYGDGITLDGTLSIDGTYNVTDAESGATGTITATGAATGQTLSEIATLRRKNEFTVQGTGLVD